MAMSLNEVISSLWSNMKTYLGNNYLSKTGKAASSTVADKATSDASGNNIVNTYATKLYVDNEISGIVNSAPETLDTLNELASALGDDPNFATTIATQIGTKADNASVVHTTGDETVAGTKTFSSQINGNISGSSTSCTGNSVSATKLATGRTINIQDADGTNTGTAVTFNGTTNGVIKLPATIKATITGNADTANQFSANKSVTLTGDVTGTASSNAGWSVATTLANSGATAGTYGPTADVTGNNNATIVVPQITVDAKGRVTAVTTKTLTCKNNTYTVNDATLTIQKNGTTVKTFTANASSNVTANITVPTKVSELTNDSGFLTSHQTVTNSAPTLAWGATSTIGGVGGTNLTVKMPTNPNTDTLMTQNVSTTATTYPILLCPTANATANQGAKSGLFASAVKVNPSTGMVTASGFTGDVTGNVTGNCSGTAGNVAWANVSGKPSTYTPSSHTHDDRYYTETEVNNLLSGKANTSGTYSSLTVGNATKATQDASGNVITNTYATKTELNTKANDSSVVHTSGDETIGGNKIFNNDIRFKSTLSVTEKPTSNQYSRLMEVDKDNNSMFSLQYANRTTYRDIILYVADYTGSNAGVALRSDKQFCPLTNNEYSLGAPAFKWANVYATNFYGDSGSFSIRVEAPWIRATDDLGLVLANKDSNAPTTTSGWNQVQFYDKNMVQLGYFQLASLTDHNVYYLVGKKNTDLTTSRNIFWDVDADVFGCNPSNTVSLGSSSNRWSQLHCTEITTYSPNFLRCTYGSYGSFWRQDGTNLYLMLTNKDDQNGTYNSYRPIQVALATGKTYVNGVDVTKLNSVATVSNTAGGTTSGTMSTTIGTMLFAYIVQPTNDYANVTGSQVYAAIITTSSDGVVYMQRSNTAINVGTWRVLGVSAGYYTSHFCMVIRVA